MNFKWRSIPLLVLIIHNTSITTLWWGWLQCRTVQEHPTVDSEECADSVPTLALDTTIPHLSFAEDHDYRWHMASLTSATE